ACFDTLRQSSVHAPHNGPNASFIGFLNQSEIHRAYVAADCLVLPSDAKETWGLVVNEAMASGLPCTVSDACRCAEDLVKPIRPGLCYPVCDIIAFVRAMAAAVPVPPPPQLLGAQIAKYDISKPIDGVENLYLERAQPSRRRNLKQPSAVCRA